jgi:hypothetical protein
MSVHKFKVGDKIRRTGASYHYVTQGAEYTVAGVEDNGLLLTGAGGIRYDADQFEHAPPTPAPAPSKYETAGAELGRLVAEKQAAYQDSHGKAGDVLRILYPNGIKPEQYDDALTVTRMVDKLFRLGSGNKRAFGESPYRDLAGYALLGLVRDEAAKK